MRQHNISLVKSNSEKNAKLSVFPTYLSQSSLEAPHDKMQCGRSLHIGTYDFSALV